MNLGNDATFEEEVRKIARQLFPSEPDSKLSGVIS